MYSIYFYICTFKLYKHLFWVISKIKKMIFLNQQGFRWVAILLAYTSQFIHWKDSKNRNLDCLSWLLLPNIVKEISIPEETIT